MTSSRNFGHKLKLEKRGSELPEGDGEGYDRFASHGMSISSPCQTHKTGNHRVCDYESSVERNDTRDGGRLWSQSESQRY